MYGVDTNILVRFFTQDDLKQARMADKFILQHCANEGAAFINCIVLCELVWVLESGYKYKREQIAQTLEQLLRVKQFHIENISAVQHAVMRYKNVGTDFADALIAEINSEYSCEYTVSFDKKSIRDKLFIAVEDLL
ncbi:MAG: type II toxin-antitoxin system VapC family toxin [Gammaproteobacteria bacterium]|nr:type II toxin-antitoxin system VapC family toxin [Gammaproteobacteria bacterium]